MKKKRGCLMWGFILIGLFAIAIQLIPINNESTIIDTEQFAKISPDELISIMGEPDRKEETSYTNPRNEVYPLMVYTYKNGGYEFLIIDNKVVSLTVYGSENEKIPYSSDTSLFRAFGINQSNNKVKLETGETVSRYESLSDKVEEFWVERDSKNENVEWVKIRYDKIYFGELPRMAMSVSEKTDFQLRCQKGVESLLKAPSTAKFPSITEWYFSKDKEKIIVQSYVDAQNGFGAQIRSDFRVTFSASGETVTSLIFEGQEYIK